MLQLWHLWYDVDGCNGDVCVGLLRHSEYSWGKLVVSNVCSKHTAPVSALPKDRRCHEEYKVGCGFVFFPLCWIMFFQAALAVCFWSALPVTDCFFKVALFNRADHIHFHHVVCSSFFFLSSPNLSGRRLDVCHTSTHGVALVQI